MNTVARHSISLPKWPAMVVVGKTVTPEQAQEIIVRTSGLSFQTNDWSFLRKLYKIVGLKCDEYGHLKDYEEQDALCERLGILRLEYLDNEQICSCYLNGPHGWIDWRGNVGCRTFNIGKWPHVDEVLIEWNNIAQAFPYLDLKCQLFSGEQCEDGTVPLIQFNVASGKAETSDPVDDLGKPQDNNTWSFMCPNGERGCTIEQFEQAFKMVVKKASPK